MGRRESTQYSYDRELEDYQKLLSTNHVYRELQINHQTFLAQAFDQAFGSNPKREHIKAVLNKTLNQTSPMR
jgi:hypothetical protein